jgi:hypothetical protein
MQLVAYGAQDIYLTGNPQITFFKVVYRRHTNFSIESIEQTFNGSVDFGRKVSCTVSRNGDLIHKVYLQVDLPALTVGSGTVAWARNIGHVLIDEVSIEIGGQTIDKHYGDWLNIWNELTQTAERMDGYDLMIGNDAEMISTSAGTTTGTPAYTVYIPLQFWFCRNPGLALPLIALQYHEVKFNITFRPASECTVGSGTLAATPVISNASLYVDYIYLDTDERRQFAQVQHEYLIEQLQFTGAESFNNAAVKTKLSLNHPCKELVWVVQPDTNASANKWADYTYTGAHTIVDAKLQLNGHDRFSTRKAGYFGLVQPYQHHTRIPDTGIYMYSFALNPEQHQPSGTVNMSRIDNATLLLNLNQGMIGAGAVKLRVYAVNYNVLRIMAGMGGLAYSN